MRGMEPTTLDINLPSPSIRPQAIGGPAIIDFIQSVFANRSLWFQLVVPPEPIEERFKRLVSEWQRDTAHLSVVKRKIKHRAYQEIIEMQYAGVPLILKELSELPNHWMPALKDITGIDPCPENATFEQAIEAWLAWGRKNKFLA